MALMPALAILTLGLAKIGWAVTPAPFEILREADQARGNLEGITWKVDITAEHGIDTNHMMLKIQARGFDINGTVLGAVPLEIRPSGEYMLLSLFLLVLMSLLAAFFPARRAARMNIVKGLGHV